MYRHLDFYDGGPVPNLIVLLVSLIASFAAFGQSASPDFPTKPIRLVVPSPPGGTLDLVARLLALALAKELGANVVVDNRGGAGGSIGSDIVAKAAPDGYTVLLADGSALAINTTLRNDLPFDAQRDLMPLALVARFPFLLLATPTFAPTSVAELVKLGKAAPGTISYASPGIGTPQHLGGAMLSSMAGIELVHVAYKGGGPVLTDLLGGQVPVAFVGMPPALTHVKSSKLKALAISSEKRSPLLSNVPTLVESGYPKFEAHIWFGFFAPAGVPPAIAARLEEAARRALADTELRVKVAEQGVEILAQPSAALAAYLSSETRKWGELVKSTGAAAK